MKTLRVKKLLPLLFLLGGITAYSQTDQSELPGDNFSLEGALELFKKSPSPEEFEHLLNSPDSKVNNLDLNGDNAIDYIRVIDRNEGNVHAFILQAVVSETESQDVAVIELEKLANGKAVLQITGDADIYGIETIIEPTEEVRVNAGTSTARTVVNVWAWPSVQYIYNPYYSVWISPWRWSVRPVWWSPWRPVSYYMYDPWWAPYRPYYSVCYSHRVAYAHNLYRPYRTTSVAVYNRHYNQMAHYRSSRNGNDHPNRDDGRYDHNRRNNQRNDYRSSGNDQNHGTRSRNAGQDRSSRPSATSWNNRQSQDFNHRSSRTVRDNSSSEGRSSSGFRGRYEGSQQRRPSASVNSVPDISHRQYAAPSGDWGGRQRSSVNQNRGSQGNAIARPQQSNGGSRSSGEHHRGRH